MTAGGGGDDGCSSRARWVGKVGWGEAKPQRRLGPSTAVPDTYLGSVIKGTNPGDAGVVLAWSLTSPPRARGPAEAGAAHA